MSARPFLPSLSDCKMALASVACLVTTNCRCRPSAASTAPTKSSGTRIWSANRPSAVSDSLSAACAPALTPSLEACNCLSTLSRERFSACVRSRSSSSPVSLAKCCCSSVRRCWRSSTVPRRFCALDLRDATSLENWPSRSCSLACSSSSWIFSAESFSSRTVLPRFCRSSAFSSLRTRVNSCATLNDSVCAWRNASCRWPSSASMALHAACFSSTARCLSATALSAVPSLLVISVSSASESLRRRSASAMSSCALAA